MEIFAYLLIVFVLIWILVLGCKNVDPVSDEELYSIAKELHEKEETLKKMNFLISEVGRISKEKTKAIKASDWDQLKKLHEEEDRNRITFNYLSNKN